MSGYRRFIAYVYEYEGGKKGESRGFIRVEAKNSFCRMNYNLTGIYGREAVPTKIYAYVREKGECSAFLLGTCDLSGLRVEFETELPENNIGGSGYALEDLCGLILQADSGEVYGSIWEEQPVALQEIKLPKAHIEKKREEEMGEVEEDRNIQAAEVLEEIQKGAGEQEGEQIPGVENTDQEPFIRESLEEDRKQEWESEDVKEPEEIRRVNQEKEVETDLEERAEGQRESGELPGTAMWEEQEQMEEGQFSQEQIPKPEGRAAVERMRENEDAAIPNRLQPPSFCDNGITQCRRITPGDFRILNRKDRGLLTNRFLRHGFSRYGHLLIGKREEDGQYILGVPGIYESQEALMAGMFGFPYFKETGGQNSHSRHFGYWYRVIDQPEELS